MMDLPKAKLIELGWLPSVAKQPVMYIRTANGSILYVWHLRIAWRMPWLKRAIYQQGFSDGMTRANFGD